MSHAHVCLTGVEDELLIGLIDGIVCEVDEIVLQVLLLSLLVFLSGETGQALFVDVDADWIAAINEDVYPHVELQVIDEQWIIDVQLDDTCLTLKFLNFSKQHDALALRRCFRLEDIDGLLFLRNQGIVTHELANLRWD